MSEDHIPSVGVDQSVCSMTSNIQRTDPGNRILTAQTADDIRRLSHSFQAQEQALTDLDGHLQATAYAPQQRSVDNRDPGYETIGNLRDLCQEALSATKVRRAGQKFGDMKTDDQSMAMQGIVGEAQHRIQQSFGNLTTSKNSRAFQGQMDAASFALMFGGLR